MSQEIKEAVEETTILAAEPSQEPVDAKDETATPDTAPAGSADTPEEEEEDFGAMLEDYIVIPRKGQTLTCPVTDITADGVYLNLSSKQTGLIPSHRLSSGDKLRVGDKVPVLVTKADSEDAYVYCDLIRDKAWTALDKARIERAVLECEVTRINKGGIDADYQGIHVFIPGSKSGMAKDEDKSGLIGKTVRVRILETDRKTRRVIGMMRSDRSEQRAEAAKKLWESIDVGMKYEGTVKNMTDFAAFIDLGGVDGLCHVSQIAFGHTEKPSDVLSTGDKVTVWVTRLDKAKKRISLTMKDPSKDCWTEFASRHQPGDIVEGTVRNLADFGAFVTVFPGVEGLVRVSQISYQHIDYPGDVLAEGDKVNAKILEMNVKDHRIALTMKGIDQPAEP